MSMDEAREKWPVLNKLPLSVQLSVMNRDGTRVEKFMDSIYDMIDEAWAPWGYKANRTGRNRLLNLFLAALGNRLFGRMESIEACPTCVKHWSKGREGVCLDCSTRLFW